MREERRKIGREEEDRGGDGVEMSRDRDVQTAKNEKKTTALPADCHTSE